MQNVQKIIVSVDFYTHTPKLVKFAIDVANKLGGKLIFVHVMEEILPFFDDNPESYKQLDKKIFHSLEEKMENLLKNSRLIYPECEGVILKGDITDSIVAYAEENQIDLIIMGTHGGKGIEKILLGSVAERVLKRASCPVLMYNPYKGKIQ